VGSHLFSHGPGPGGPSQSQLLHSPQQEQAQILEQEFRRFEVRGGHRTEAAELTAWCLSTTQVERQWVKAAQTVGRIRLGAPCPRPSSHLWPGEA
jgi:hypothetical protein